MPFRKFDWYFQIKKHNSCFIFIICKVLKFLFRTTSNWFCILIVHDFLQQKINQPKTKKIGWNYISNYKLTACLLRVIVCDRIIIFLFLFFLRLTFEFSFDHKKKWMGKTFDCTVRSIDASKTPPSIQWIGRKK